MNSIVRCLVILVGAGCAVLQAQSVAPAAPTTPGYSSPKDDSIVELARFEVKTDLDSGYQAADTLSAGRLSTNLLMTPSDTTALTREFLNDLGAFNMVEASSWLTSAIEQDQGAQNGTSSNIDPRDNGANTVLRGQATQASTRNYFPSSTTPGEYNVERVEGESGPNAILYGVGGPGGQVNYITKRALGRNFVRTRARASSFGTLSGSIDLNRRLNPQLDFRYNGFWSHGRTWQDRVKDNTIGNAFNVIYRPTRSLRVSLDADVGRSYRSWRVDTYTDGSSSWNGAGFSGPITAAQAGVAGLSVLGSGNPSNFTAYIHNVGLMNWRGYGQTAGSSHNLYPFDYPDDRVIPHLPRIPHWSYNVAPDDVHVTAQTRDLQASVRKTFDFGLTAEIAFVSTAIAQDGAKNTFSPGIQGIRIDPNHLLPNGQPNPNYGKYYTQMEYGYNVDGSFRKSQAERVAFGYPIKLGRFGVQNFSLIGQRQEDRSRSRFNRYYNTPATGALIANNNLVYVFRYFDDPTTKLPDLRQILPLKEVKDTDNSARNRDDSVTFGAAGSYFGNRLSLVGGFRRESYTSDSKTIGTRDALTGTVTNYIQNHLEAMHNSSSVGAVYFPIKPLGAYVHYDEGFSVLSNPNPNLDGSYSPTAIASSRNFSYGLRLNLLQGKLVGSIGHYRTNTSGIVGVTLTNYNNALRANGAPYIPAGNLVTAAAVIADASVTQGQGWEANATAALSKNFRLLFNVALPDVKIIELYPAFRKWFNTQLPTFEKWANDPTLPATDTRRSLAVTAITSGQRLLTDSAVGRTQTRIFDYRINIFGNYTVPTTFLKGLRVGAGAQFFGPRIIGAPLADPDAYLKDRGYHLATASLGYRFNRRVVGEKVDVDVQLNIVNLLAHKDPLFAGTAVYNNTIQYPNYYTIAEPRTVRLTTTFSF
jgi:outer membrane receptor for monomeric catechols